MNRSSDLVDSEISQDVLFNQGIEIRVSSIEIMEFLIIFLSIFYDYPACENVFTKHKTFLNALVIYLHYLFLSVLNFMKILNFLLCIVLLFLKYVCILKYIIAFQR